MPLKKENMKIYNAAYYREHRSSEIARQRKYYNEHKDEINAKARAKRKEEKERKLKEDRKNGKWNF